MADTLTDVPAGFVPDAPQVFVPDMPAGFVPDQIAQPNLLPPLPDNWGAGAPNDFGAPSAAQINPVLTPRQGVVSLKQAAGTVLGTSPLDKVLPEATVKPEDSVPIAIGKEAYNLAASVPKFATSLGGVATAGLGVVVKPALVAGGFSLDMLKNLGDQIQVTIPNWSKLTPGQKAGAITQMVGTGAFAGFLGHGAVKSIVPKQELRPDVIPTQQPTVKPLSTIGEAAGDSFDKLKLAPTEKPLETQQETTIDRPKEPISLPATEISQSPATSAEGTTKNEPVTTQEPKPPAQSDETHGIAARVLDRRAAAGAIEPIEPGEGISPQASVERGRELLRQAKDPSATFEQLIAPHDFADKVAIARARGEVLAKQANEAYDKFGVDSPEYQFAKKAGQDWAEKTKMLSTEAHKAFVAHQGEVNLDTGDFHALRQAHLESTGHDFEPEQVEKAQAIATESKAATAGLEEARVNLYDHLAKTIGQRTTTASEHVINLAEKIVAKLDARAEVSRKELAKIFARTSAGVDPTIIGHLANIGASHIGHVGLDFAKWSDSMIRQYGDKVKPYLDRAWIAAQNKQELKGTITKEKETTDVQKVWKHVKDVYLDNGETDFGKIVNKTAIELGRPVNEVRKLLAQPKGVKVLTDEMYAKQRKARQLQNNAKQWLKDQQQNTLLLYAGKIPRALFKAKVFGHGTVGMITHVGNQMFYPPAAKDYWSNFIKQYPMAFGKGGIYHEKMMEDLVHRPLYAKALRSGLVVDPTKFSDDYQQPQMTKFFGGMGNRGFDALKLYRMDRFEHEWGNLPESLKTKEMGALLANEINHSTGVVKAPIPKSLQSTLTTAFFAPKLEASRWQWLIGDPARSAATVANWAKASPEERYAAISQFKKKAWFLGTYLAALAANQGLLSAMNSQQKINFTDPTKPDWLSFKFAGHNIGVVSPIISLVMFLGKEFRDLAGQRTKFQKLQGSRLDAAAGDLAKYGRNKLSPFGGLVADAADRHDWAGNTMPYSNEKPKYKDSHQLTYGEYAANQILPIPFEDALNEVWKSQGMSEGQIKTYLNAIITGAVVGGTGARVNRDTAR